MKWCVMGLVLAVCAAAKPLEFSLECPGFIAGEPFNASGLLLVSPDELDRAANAALAAGKPLEAMAFVEEGVKYWRKKFKSARRRKDKISALHGLRWAQTSALAVLSLPDFPAADKARYRTWIDDELLESADLLVDQHKLIGNRIRVPGGFSGLEIKAAEGYELDGLLEDVQEIVPGQPYKMIYAPSVLSRMGGAAAIDRRGFFFLSHEAMTALAPTFREKHEFTHLLHESNLVQRRPSNFYGFDQAVSAPLPGPAADPYASAFSHNEPYNYQEDALYGIELFTEGAAAGDNAKRDEGLELVINSAHKGKNASLRQLVIASGLAAGLKALRFQRGDSLSFAAVSALNDDGGPLLDTTCVTINETFYVGLFMEPSGSGGKIPWIVTFDNARLFTLPLLDFPLDEAKVLIRDFAQIHKAIEEGDRSALGGPVPPKVEVLLSAAKLAAKEYEMQAAGAAHMRDAFDPLLQSGMLWLADRSPTRLADFSQAMQVYRTQTVPAVRADRTGK